MEDNTKTESPRKNAIGWPIILAGLLLIVLLWLLYPLILKFVVGIDAENLGLWGDQFGGFNALFSGLAFAGLILTLYFQSNELALQREELELQREEQKEATKQLEQQAKQLEIQAEQLKAQNSLASVQAFENGFFLMIDSFDKYVSQTNTTGGSGKVPFEGHYAYEYIFRMHKLDIRRFFSGTKEPVSATRYRQEHYRKFWNTYRIKLGPYFNLLLELCKKIEEIEEYEKSQYIGILKARLSISELGLICIYCAARTDDKQLLNYVKKFDLLEQLDDTDLLKSNIFANVLAENYSDLPFYERLRSRVSEETLD